jgi:hypothetical protein
MQNSHDKKPVLLTTDTNKNQPLLATPGAQPKVALSKLEQSHISGGDSQEVVSELES